MNRALVVVAVLCLAACSSSGKPGSTARSTTSSPTTGRHPTTAPPTTKPVTSTTHVNPVVADGFAQLALTNAVNAAQTIYHQSYDYTNVSPAALAALDASAQFGTMDQSNAHVIGVLAQDRNDVLLVTRSPSGRWYCVTENATDGISYGEGATRGSVDSNGQCQQPAWPPPGQDQHAF